MENNIINELKFASKKKKNAVLGYVYCNYLLDMFEEVKQLKLERDTAIFVARERLDHIEKVQNQKEIFELRYLKEERKSEELNKRIEELELDLQHTNSQLANVSKRCIKAIEYIDKNGMTNITCLGNQTTKRELFKENGSLYELREILVGSDKA